MKISVLTLFPEFFDSFRNTSIVARALSKQEIEFETIDYRTYTLDKHNHVDDTPYGGGAGMVLMAQPIVDALADLPDSHVVMLTPQGKTFTRAKGKGTGESRAFGFGLWSL